jgi:predicted helicase
MSPISQYLSEVQKILQSGDAREHAYRPAFHRLIESLTSDIQVINEPAYTGGNAPDFLFKRGDVPISYAECKDVTIDISDKEVVKQANRYVEAFGKILLTNYLEFQILDENGEVAKITIATKSGNSITPMEENFSQFENLVNDYITPSSRTIRSAKKLAEIMASKARLLRDNSLAAIRENKQSEIYAQYQAFKEVLIRDMTEEEFVDMYAQTLVYGLFVARYFDKTLSDFSRYEAHDLLPSTNPLLKKFFGHVAGTEFDSKIAWMVDSLIEAYKGTDVKELMRREFKKKQKDPVLHFYETFLSEYDQSLRKARGVYYTPEPVVSFIVRSVDQILKTKFDLPKGLADTTKVEHEFRAQGIDGRTKDGSKKVKEQIHKVQILDPAVGTGTFLNEVIYEIHKTFKGQEGRWNGYVEKELLPRLHGFELMMASYTMAHLKLGVTLKELGYEGMTERLSVWLTNSLEESVHEVPNLFMSQWLTQESNEASKIKSEMPIMVVVGNPPYAASSMNPSKNQDGSLTSIGNLVTDYKKDLDEKKINLDDDYIKFIRHAENAVEKTGYGVVAMITNNSFIDGITHRQMRKHLLKTFDEIYILDLKGNSKKKESGNIFDIQQGVSINIFVKSNSGDTKKVFHSSADGGQSEKFQYLDEADFFNIAWEQVELDQKYSFFVPKDFSSIKNYEKGFKLDEFFLNYSSGIETQKDHLAVHFNNDEAKKVFKDLKELDREKILKKYNIKEGRDWKIEKVKNSIPQTRIVQSLYKPFDIRSLIYSSRSGIVAYPRNSTLSNLRKENLLLVCNRQIVNDEWSHVLITDLYHIHGVNYLGNKGRDYHFPLYLYSENEEKLPNFNIELWRKLDLIAGKSKPEDILNYLYAVLHSPTYREKYKEFLKIDFPRVPYPTSKDTFWKLVELGRELRELYLLKSPAVNNHITTFPESGDNIVTKKMTKTSIGFESTDKENNLGRVWINDAQYFGNIPKEVWEFYIGGYQPAQKWLKDRNGRVLTDLEIDHYQQMIVAMNETMRIMNEIDNVSGL